MDKITIYPVDPQDMHDLGVRRFTSIEPEVTALPRGGKMIGPATADALREYITRDIEATEELHKRHQIDLTIAEALEMQRRGRPAPIPRPTYLAVAIRAIYDDLESWSSPK